MTRHRGRYHWIAVLAVLPTLSASGSAAQTAEDEDEPSPPAQPETPPPPKPEPQPVPVAASPAPAAPAPYIEPMGPDTFPGRMRGLYGGSLWLEPTFHGLQWPQNTRTGLGVSGMFWVDSGYEMIKRDRPQLLDSSMYLQQGRGLLRVTPTYVHGSFFVQGQAELVANLCQSTTSVCTAVGTFSNDDLWIRVGQWNLWDLKLGRFEGWEIYHLGMGLDPYTLERQGAGMFNTDSDTGTGPRLEAPSFYGVNYMHDRPTDGLAVGYAAAHLYATEYLRGELLGKLGSDNYRADNATQGNPFNYLGGRLSGIFDIGWFKLKIGGEYQKCTAVTQVIGGQPDGTMAKKDSVEERTQMGLGGSMQFIIDPIVEFGLNAAIGKQRQVDGMGREVQDQSYTTTSVGAFANVRLVDDLLLGLGANGTTQEDGFRADGSSANDYTTHLQGFAALQYLLAGQLYLKVVLAFARAKFQPSDIDAPIWNNDMYSGRIRLMYLY